MWLVTLKGLPLSRLFSFFKWINFWFNSIVIHVNHLQMALHNDLPQLSSFCSQTALKRGQQKPGIWGCPKRPKRAVTEAKFTDLKKKKKNSFFQVNSVNYVDVMLNWVKYYATGCKAVQTRTINAVFRLVTLAASSSPLPLSLSIPFAPFPRRLLLFTPTQGEFRHTVTETEDRRMTLNNFFFFPQTKQQSKCRPQWKPRLSNTGKKKT